jgi:hypothetical protein
VLPRRLQQSGADVSRARPIAAGAAVVAVLASSAAAAPDQVTILVRPTVVGGDQLATVQGTVETRRADEIVTIQANDCGPVTQGFRDVAEVRTGEGGSWSTELRPRINTTLRAVWKGDTSAQVPVRQRAWVYLIPRSRASGKLHVGVSGKVSFWRKRVLVQRFDRRLGRWTTIRSVVLGESGFSNPQTGAVSAWADFKASTVRKGSLLRAVFPLSQARPCYLGGVSNLLQR